MTYGQGLGGIAVLEQPARRLAARRRDRAACGSRRSPSAAARAAQELATALGTVLRFDRGGVRYTVIGSVPPAAAEAAAKAL